MRNFFVNAIAVIVYALYKDGKLQPHYTSYEERLVQTCFKLDRTQDKRFLKTN